MYQKPVKHHSLACLCNLERALHNVLADMRLYVCLKYSFTVCDSHYIRNMLSLGENIKHKFVFFFELLTTLCLVTSSVMFSCIVIGILEFLWDKS